MGCNVVEEQENYGASGQRLRNEIRCVSPMRNNPPPTDGALCSPTRLLRSSMNTSMLEQININKLVKGSI